METQPAIERDQWMAPESMKSPPGEGEREWSWEQQCNWIKLWRIICFLNDLLSPKYLHVVSLFPPDCTLWSTSQTPTVSQSVSQLNWYCSLSFVSLRVAFRDHCEPIRVRTGTQGILIDEVSDQNVENIEVWWVMEEHL